MPGYVSAACYRLLLSQAAVVVGLTNDQDCLMCAAYEAVAANRALIVSDTPALRDCFGDLACYTSNEPEAIMMAVSRALVRKDDGFELDAARREFDAAFNAEFNGVLATLSAIDAEASPSRQNRRLSVDRL
jgi:hypothetical protein